MALKKKVQISDNLFLNIAIGITGICLLGFIYSFSQNAANDGVPVNVTFQNPEDLTLAVDIYEKKPIKNITVEVLNGCGVNGLAAKATDFFRFKQIDVLKSDNADRYDYLKTQIISRNENINSLKAVANCFNLSTSDTNHILINPDESLGVDVTIILGKDINTFEEITAFLANY